MSVIRAVDVGYGHTKFVARRAPGAIDCRMFPSLAPLASDIALGLGKHQQRDTAIIEVDGVRYEVGRDARTALKAHHTRILHNQYANSPEHLALLRGALFHMDVNEIDLLVVGLPVALMHERGRALTERLKGAHPLADGRRVHVRHVWALAQPLGGLYDAMSRGAMSSGEDQVSMIVDPGYFTIDWSSVYRNQVMPERTGSFPGGVYAVLQTIARGIAEDLGMNFTDLDAVDRAMATGQLRVGGRTIDLARYEQRANVRIEEAVTAIANSVGDGLDVENVIVVGGGSGLYEAALRRRFPMARVLIAPDPIFANVRGFQLAGEHRNSLAA